MGGPTTEGVPVQHVRMASVRRRWYEDPWLWGSLAALGGAVAFFKPAREAVVDVFKRGRKLSYGELDPVLGIITEPPESLRAAASTRYGQDIPEDVYAAARMVRSEGAAQGNLRVHVALNDLITFPYASTLFELLTYSTDPARRGWYGKQYSPAVPPDYPKANKRRYATSGNPYEGDVLTASAAIREREQGIDRANGASKFIDRSSMGVQEGSRSFAEVDAEWKASGYTAFTLPEYGSDLVLYRKA